MVVSQFGSGLNTQDTPAELDPSAAQDLLNVNIQPGGASIFKRDGYGLFQTLPSFSTAAVHGMMHFQQVSGSDVQLVGSDINLYASVSDATFVKIATGTDAATWQCADSQGNAYCLSSSRDTAVKTDGTAANTSYQTGIPLGTMLTFTPTQLAVAGVSGNESTLYISQQNAFTTFTIGVLPSSSFTEPIASPGSRITHLAYYFGKLFWWKDQSFGYATFTNQSDWQLTIVSNQIGTLDNSDAFWNSSGFDSGAKFSGTASANAEKSPGGIFFRGQDNHLYVYDGYYLTRLSRVISPTVTGASRKKANSWTQTSQSDFQGGSVSPAGSISLTINVGDIMLSTTTMLSSTDTTQSDFAQGTSINVDTTTIPGAITLTSGTVPTNQTQTTNNTSLAIGNILVNNPPGCTANRTLSQSFLTSNSGTQVIRGVQVYLGYNGTCAGTTLRLKTNSSGTPGTNIVSGTVSCSGITSSGAWYTVPLASTTLTGNTSYWITLDAAGSIGNAITWFADTTQPYANGTMYYSNDACTSPTGTLAEDAAFQTDIIPAYNTSGSFLSRAIDIGFSTNTWLWNWSVLTSSFDANSGSISYQTQVSSASNGVFDSLVTASTGSIIGSNTRRFIKYKASFSTSDQTKTPVMYDAIINTSGLSKSSGTYYSAVNNANGLTSWGTFGTSDGGVGTSTIAYYTRSSTNSFTIQSSTPAWVLQTKNATVTASTGTFFQMHADLSITVATDYASISDFTFNWFEGSAADKAYITYFNDAIWFSVSASSSVSTNNRIFYWDILNGAWLIYDIPSNGFLIENNRLYFGDPSAGKVYQFGNVTTDNGSAINSYWRSKSFLGTDPFVQNEFVQADFVLGESSTTLTYTYTLDSKTATAYSMTAYDSAASLIQRNFLLPVGKIGKYYDFKIGDNSSNAPWRLMGHRVRYTPLNWIPVTR